jgi:hypothetical protein
VGTEDDVWGQRMTCGDRGRRVGTEDDMWEQRKTSSVRINLVRLKKLIITVFLLHCIHSFPCYCPLSPCSLTPKNGGQCTDRVVFM